MDGIKPKSTDNAKKVFPYNANSDLVIKANKTWGKNKSHTKALTI